MEKIQICQIIDRAEEIRDEIIDIRRTLHMYPELGNEEFKTVEIICDYLKKCNIEYEIVTGTGVVGIIRGNGSEKTIALRADIDALPIEEKLEVSYKSRNKGLMHACGHDIHTAILLGSARLLSENREALNGNVKLFFQPAEETTGGAKRMIEAGCMEKPKVENVLGIHVNPHVEVGKIEIKPGKLFAGSDMFKIIVSGTSSHGASPDKGVDAIVIAANIIVALQSIVSRSISPVESAVVTIGSIQGGTKENIVASQVELTGIIRTLDEDTRTFTKDKIRAISENIAYAMGGSAKLEIKESYPPLINDSEFTLKIKEEIKKLIGAENVLDKEFPNMGAEDFAYFAREVPSCFFEIGVKGIGQQAVDLHNEYFCPDEQAIIEGIKLQVNNVFFCLK